MRNGERRRATPALATFRRLLPRLRPLHIRQPMSNKPPPNVYYLADSIPLCFKATSVVVPRIACRQKLWMLWIYRWLGHDAKSLMHARKQHTTGHVTVAYTHVCVHVGLFVCRRCGCRFTLISSGLIERAVSLFSSRSLIRSPTHAQYAHHGRHASQMNTQAKRTLKPGMWYLCCYSLAICTTVQARSLARSVNRAIRGAQYKRAIVRV